MNKAIKICGPIMIGITLVGGQASAWAVDSVAASLTNPNVTATPSATSSTTSLDPNQVGADAICDPVLNAANELTAQQCSDKQAQDPTWTLTAHCQRVMSDAVLVDPSSSNQLLADCRTLKAAKAGLAANEALTKTWMAVGVGCFAVCSQPWGQTACTVASGGAAVEELMKKQQLQTLAESLMASAFVGKYVGNAIVGSGSKSASSGKKKSCYTTATFALVQALLKQQGRKTAQSAYDQAWAEIKSLYSSTAATTLGTVNTAINPNTVIAGTGGNTAVKTATALTTTGDSATTTATDPCSGTSTSSTAVISCAVSKDSSIPAIAQDPKLADTIQAATGTPLGDFLANNGSTGADAMGNAFGGSGNGAQIASNLKAATEAADPSASQNLSDGGPGAYAQAGAAGVHAAAADTGPDLSKLFGDALGQFGRNPASDAASKGVNELDFQMKNKSAEQIAQDRGISIFDRVSYRYRLTSSRLLP